MRAGEPSAGLAIAGGSPEEGCAMRTVVALYINFVFLAYKRFFFFFNNRSGRRLSSYKYYFFLYFASVRIVVLQNARHVSTAGRRNYQVRTGVELARNE